MKTLELSVLKLSSLVEETQQYRAADLENITKQKDIDAEQQDIKINAAVDLSKFEFGKKIEELAADINKKLDGLTPYNIQPPAHTFTEQSSQQNDNPNDCNADFDSRIARLEHDSNIIKQANNVLLDFDVES